MRGWRLFCSLTLIGLLTGCADPIQTSTSTATGPQAPVKPSSDSLPPSEQVTLNIAAAADLRSALPELLTKFQTSHPSVATRVTYGASGSLYAQIDHGAPFDLFLSADIQFPRQLGDGGKADLASVFPYAVGHLVVWVPKSSALQVEPLGMRVVLESEVQKIAIANPKVAPYGRAAEAALKHFGVYEAVKDKLVLGENVSQAAQFVESGNADVGIIGLSLAMSPSMQGKGRFWPVPAEAHPELLQGGVILTACRDRAAAEGLRSFLTSQSARQVFQQFGFEAPP